nr:hypothetical protein [Streptomyces sp. MMG1121]
MHPRAGEERVAEPKNFLRAYGVRLSSVLPLFERKGIALNLEAHPDDFREENAPRPTWSA